MTKEAIKKLEERKVALDADIALRSNILNSFKLKTEEAEQLRDEKILESEDKINSIKVLDSKIEAREKTIFDFDIDINAKRQDIATLNLKVNSESSKLLEEKNSFDKLVEKNRLELESKNEEVKTLNSEIVSLKDSREVLDVMNNKEIIIHNDKIDALKNTELLLKNNLNELLHSLGLKEKTLDFTTVAISQREVDKEALESKFEGFKEQVATEQKNLKEVKNRISSVNKEKSYIVKEIDELKEKLELLKSEHISRLDLVKAIEADKEAIINEAKIVGYTPKFTKYNK